MVSFAFMSNSGYGIEALETPICTFINIKKNVHNIKLGYIFSGQVERSVV